MGYNTKFSLEISGVEGLTDRQKESLYKERVDKDYTDIGAIYTEQVEEVRWYDYLQDLDRISAKYPNVLFQLTGWGEETGDYWRTWFRNGRHVSVDATFPEVDLTQLPLVDTVDLKRRDLEEERVRVRQALDKIDDELDKLRGI